MDQIFYIYLFVHLLFHTVSVSGYMTLDGRMIVEATVGKVLEGDSYILWFLYSLLLDGTD